MITNKNVSVSQGDETVVLTAKAVRGVALGVVLTAIIQSVLGGRGLYTVTPVSAQ